ncbi:uncharacterized protein [Dermacentor albipictus]|uniref:uncharacterized protein n=1 Tax=Dermacentor albipictus TaxID=60249 RepID=UPI0038FC15DC
MIRSISALKLPEFRSSDSDHSFITIQTFFHHHHLSSQLTMVVNQLQPTTTATVYDVLRSLPVDHPYDRLKTTLMQRTIKRSLAQLAHKIMHVGFSSVATVNRPPDPSYHSAATWNSYARVLEANEELTRSKAKVYVVGAVLFVLMMSIAVLLLMERQSAAERKSEQDAATTETEEEVWFHTLPGTKKAASGRAATLPPKKISTAHNKTNASTALPKPPAASSRRPSTSTPEVAPKGSTNPTSQSLHSSTVRRQPKSVSSSPHPHTTETSFSKRKTPQISQVLSSTAIVKATSVHPHAGRPLVVCVVGGQLRTTMPPPDGLCAFMIFEHVRVARQSHDFIASSNQVAFDNFMKMAAGNTKEQFLLSLSTALEYDESLEVRYRALDIMRRYRDQNVRGYGFAHYQVASTGIDSGKLWKHHSMLANLKHWSKDPVILFLGLELYHQRSYSDVYITGLIAEAAASMDFLILRTHLTTPPSLASNQCHVELIGSWTKDSLNDKLLLSMEDAARFLNSSRLERDVTVPLLLSHSLAVVEYEVDKDSQAQEPRLQNLRCTKRSLQPFRTVCHSNSTYLKGGQTKPTFCHYDDDPVNGRWRTYKTALDMVNEIQSVTYSADPLLTERFGWAFYDVDLEDYGGDCEAYWHVNGGTSKDSKAAAYYRLKNAVRQLNALSNRKPAVPKVTENAVVYEAAQEHLVSEDSSVVTRKLR